MKKLIVIIAFLITTATQAQLVAPSSISILADTYRCALTTAWSPLSGFHISIFYNGKPYADGNSGYAFFSPSTSAISAEFTVLKDTNPADTKYEVFVRVYGSKKAADGNWQVVDSANYVDSKTVTYIVPSTFKCYTPPTKGKGKNK